jgi:hypothetical protein
MRLPFIFLNNQKRQRKWPPQSAPWTFAQRSQSEMTDEHFATPTLSSFVMSSGVETFSPFENQIG